MEDKRVVDEELQRVLNQLRKQDKKFWNVNAVKERLFQQWEDLGLDETLKDSPVGLSRTAVENAYAGSKISKKTQTSLRVLVNKFDKSLLYVPLEGADLNLGRFWGVLHKDFRKASKDVIGHYQTYARSNIDPKIIWLGHLSFRLGTDDTEPRLIAQLETHRPALGLYGEKRIISDGFACPKGTQTFFVVFRSRFEEDDEGGALCIFERLDRNHKGEIDRMRAYVVQYEAEKSGYFLSKWIVKRKAPDEIRQEYVELSEFGDQSVLDSLEE